MTWERREYEVSSKAATDHEIDSIRYDTIAHHYAMMGAGTFFSNYKRLHDFIDYLLWEVIDLQGDCPEMNITEKMDCTAHYRTMDHRFELFTKIIQQAFSGISPPRTRWGEKYYRNEACDHLRKSGRTGKPQMMINGKWQDLKEIKDEDGGPSVWVRDDGNDNGGNDENRDAQ